MRIGFFLILILPILALSQEPVLMLPRGHTESVEFLYFTPDGNKLISGGNDGTVKLWDANKGRLLFDFIVDEGLWELKLSPDGSIVAATGTTTPAIFLISTGTGKLLTKLETHTSQVRTLAFSPDGSKLLSGSFDETVCLWDMPSGKLSLQLDLRSEIRDVNFSPDGDKFLVSSKYGTYVYNRKGKLQKELPMRLHAQEAMFSPLGNYIVTCGVDSVKFWSAKSYQFLAGFKGSQNHCGENPNSDPCPTQVTAAFSADEKTAYFSFSYYPLMYKDVRLISMEDFSTIAQPQVIGEKDKPMFYDGGTKIATVSNEDLLIISAKTGEVLKSLNGEMGNSIEDLAYSPLNKEFAIGDYNSEIHILRQESLSKELTIKGKAQSFQSVSFYGTSLAFHTGFSALLDTDQGKINNIARKTRHPHDEHILMPDSSYLEIWYDEIIRKAPLKGIRADTILKTNNWIRQPSLSADGKTLAIVTGSNGHPSYDKTIQLIDLAKRRVAAETTLQQNIYDVDFFADSLLILDLGTRYEIRNQNLKLLKELNAEEWLYNKEVKSWLYSSKEKLLLAATEIKLSGSNYSMLQVWKVPGFELVKEIRIETATSPFLLLSPNEKEFLLTFGNDGEPELRILSMKDFRVLDSVSTGDWPSNVRWSPSSEMIGYGSTDKNDLTVISRTGRNPVTIATNSVDWTFSPDSKTILTVKGEEMSAWDLNTSELKYKIFYLDSSDMVIQRPDKYYLATANAARHVYYVLPDLKTVGFDQLDIKYNRPDLVLRSIGSTDTTLIELYKQAYQKRIRKLNVDPEKFSSSISIPEADFVDRDKIPFTQTASQATLQIKAKDAAFSLSSFNVWADDVPLFGINGIDLQNRAIKSFDTVITVDLVPGFNQLVTSVVNSNGIESYRIPLELQYEPKTSVSEKLYFVGIGIDHFKEAGHDLNWSVKDIRDLAHSLAAKYGDRITIDTLFNKDVETNSVIALKNKLMKTGIADKVIIAYSGHGLLDQDFNYYLSTWSVDFSNPAKGGIPYTILESLTEGIPARKKLMLIDACHSGEVDKEDIAKFQFVEKDLADSGTKSTRKPVASDGTMGLRNSFELMQQLFVNIGKNTGTTIISAAAGTQFAQERSNLKNGVFTYAILEYMQDHPTATVSELKNYVNKRVSDITQGLQIPTTRSENLVVDWRVW